MEAIIFCGIQASGKSTFFQRHFFHTHMRLNLDMLKTRNREKIIMHACLAAQQPFVADNTNVSVAQRRYYAAFAEAAGFATTCYYFECEMNEAIARNASRAEAHRVPEVAILGTLGKMEVPSIKEGFDK